MTAHSTPALVEAPSAAPTLGPSNLGDLIPLERFSPAERQRIDQIAATVDWSNADSIMAQMNGPNQKFADALTQQLEGVALYEAGSASSLILELSRQIKSANLAKMKREADGRDWVAAHFGALPLVGGYISAIRYFQLNHKSIVGELDKIRQEAQRQLSRLRAVHAQLDAQERITEEVLRDLMIHIAACQKATLKAREAFERQRAAALALEPPDPFVLQKLRDFAENISIMETRLINAKASFLDKMMSIPDIRARQTAARIEMSNTIDTIQNDIPDLSSAIARLVAAYHIGQAQKGSDLRRSNREALAQANAGALEHVYLGAKKSQDGSQAEIGALAARVDRLMKMLDEGARIDQENIESRRIAEQKLLDVRDALARGLSENARKALTQG